jgi:hypothetical protein
VLVVFAIGRLSAGHWTSVTVAACVCEHKNEKSFSKGSEDLVSPIREIFDVGQLGSQSRGSYHRNRQLAGDTYVVLRPQTYGTGGDSLLEMILRCVLCSSSAAGELSFHSWE